MARRGGIESMSEFALIDLLETGESMNYSESRETIEALIASKREAREKREAQARERKLQFSQSPGGVLIAEQRRKSEEFQAETKQFIADLEAAGGMTPELKLRSDALLAKGKALTAQSKADAKSRREKQRGMRQACYEVEKTRAALKDDPGPRG
jgi:hypothetical protein